MRKTPAKKRNQSDRFRKAWLTVFFFARDNARGVWSCKMADYDVNNRCSANNSVIRKPPYMRRLSQDDGIKNNKILPGHRKDCDSSDGKREGIWSVTSSYVDEKNHRMSRTFNHNHHDSSAGPRVANTLSVKDLTENLIQLLEIDSALHKTDHCMLSALVDGNKIFEKVKFVSAARKSPGDNKKTGHCEDSSKNDALQPCVFGFKSQKCISGNEATILEQKPSEFQLDESDLIVHGDRKSVDQVKKDFGIIPSTLRPLLPWLCEDVPRELTGFDSTNCLSFLPSLLGQTEDLPCVPNLLQSPNDPLPCSYVIPPEQPWKPKKYRYCWPKSNFTESLAASSAKIKLYNKDGDLLFEQQNNGRTCDVVRKEIIELEKLIQGIGTDGSPCLVVQFQADITKLKSMVDDTNTMLEADIFRRNHRSRLDNPEVTEDHFGLRQFYADHESIIRQIRIQHAICCRELALLEQELNINEKHFSDTYMQCDI
ncbi:uncharacterized protein LOC141903919 isoform X2 [Tubulanus polymorphus]|uniref:uncharacterized protein LOC141903919 isoform X2 n=1 Tax=Tubulanus polymorphus TaxID=672921 RepID=UPI003DA65445